MHGHGGVMCTQGGPAPAPPGPSFSFIGNFSVWEPSVFSPFTNLFSLSCIRAESGLVLCFELFFLLEDLFRPRPPSWWGVSTSHSLAPQVALGSPCPRLAPALQSAAPARAWGPALGSRPAPALRWAHPCQSSGSGPGVTSCPPPLPGLLPMLEHSVRTRGLGARRICCWGRGSLCLGS